MNQPINYICVEFTSPHWMCGNEYAVDISTSHISYAKTKPAALRLAIKRLDRLKRDCERELAKQEVGK